MLDEIGLENVAKRDPVEKAEQSLQCDIDQMRILGVVHDEYAQLEHLLELAVHGLFQILGLGLSHLARREVEDLLAEQLQNFHIVLTDGLVGATRAHQLAYERGPVLRPLELEYLNQNQVQFVQVGLLFLECDLIGRVFDYQAHDVLFDRFN